MKKRIALKYCGGCNPGFDRVECVRAIQNAAGDLIEWVTVYDPDFEAALVICGCESSCLVEDMGLGGCRKIVSIRDDKRDPAEVVKNLLSEVK